MTFRDLWKGTAPFARSETQGPSISFLKPLIRLAHFLLTAAKHPLEESEGHKVTLNLVRRLHLESGEN